MKLTEYHKIADIDCDLQDTENLDSYSVKLPYIVNKWHQYFSIEALTYEKMLNDYNITYKDRYHHYATKSNLQLSTKHAFETYIKSDELIIEAKMKLAIKKQIVDFIEMTAKNLANSSFNVKNAIELMKFKSGV